MLIDRKINNNTAKPFVKWVGGKTQLILTIEKSLPNIKQANCTYIEPFVGGGAVLFWILKNNKSIKRAIINDINQDLITAYKTIRDNPNELILELQIIQNIYYSIDNEDDRCEFFILKRERFNCKNLSEIENTSLFIFLNRTCFNGLYRVNSKGLFNVPFGKYTQPTICDEKTILADREILQKVEIVCGDFEQTLQYATQDSFFYIDPPYKPLSNTSSFNSYSKEVFDDEEQIRLKKFCDNISLSGSNFILSNSDVKSNDPQNHFFDHLYSNYQIQRVLATRMVNSNPEKRGKLSELLITNYAHEKPVKVAQLCN